MKDMTAIGAHPANVDTHRMGELEPWIDENFVRSVWYGMGEQVNVKMIRDKFSGYASSTPLIFVYSRLTRAC